MPPRFPCEYEAFGSRSLRQSRSTATPGRNHHERSEHRTRVLKRADQLVEVLLRDVAVLHQCRNKLTPRDGAEVRLGRTSYDQRRAHLTVDVNQPTRSKVEWKVATKFGIPARRRADGNQAVQHGAVRTNDRTRFAEQPLVGEVPPRRTLEVF